MEVQPLLHTSFPGNSMKGRGRGEKGRRIKEGIMGPRFSSSNEGK